ncbi:MAG: SHOCT domain-containing protein [Armatimonadota bacterium]|nr:SHOCT domain-containing protein [Armatimonadota bacterium]MDR7466781.1 SHOCT domain-containing protein [Armatimonadota bacterium]MDR7492746.1 SHOCT domain-containing protein [Armatimonadota bacterium]MDR7498522.1 SHOCT domain-containing protein [Armatimonadota bacterium]MDR7504301.1 SHOCT domain-containing protein [Armatimonadota bacterium]
MGFGLMWLWMAAFWIGVVALAVWAAGRLFPGVPSPRTPTPREILDARYARGELTREQYHELRKELT